MEKREGNSKYVFRSKFSKKPRRLLRVKYSDAHCIPARTFISRYSDSSSKWPLSLCVAFTITRAELRSRANFNLSGGDDDDEDDEDDDDDEVSAHGEFIKLWAWPTKRSPQPWVPAPLKKEWLYSCTVPGTTHKDIDDDEIPSLPARPFLPWLLLLARDPSCSFEAACFSPRNGAVRSLRHPMSASAPSRPRTSRYNIGGVDDGSLPWRSREVADERVVNPMVVKKAARRAIVIGCIDARVRTANRASRTWQATVMRCIESRENTWGRRLFDS